MRTINPAMAIQRATENAELGPLKAKRFLRARTKFLKEDADFILFIGDTATDQKRTMSGLEKSRANKDLFQIYLSSLEANDTPKPRLHIWKQVRTAKIH